MIYVSTFGFALALVAVASAVAALTISLRLKQVLASRQTRIESAFAKLTASVQGELRKVSALQRELEASSTPRLAARVDELSEAVARLADTHRRFAGRFHAFRQHELPAAGGNGAVDDDEFTATLRLQGTPPVKGE